jgi:uncharacterized protein YjbJ (UPF0337 family)
MGDPNNNQVEGAAKEEAGAVEKKVGEAIGNEALIEEGADKERAGDEQKQRGDATAETSDRLDNMRDAIKES